MRLITVVVSLCVLSASATAANDSTARSTSGRQKMSAANSMVRESRVGIVINNPKSIVERLKPGDELQSALKRIASKHKLKAGVIVSAVGSLSTASLRFAGAKEPTIIEGPLEVVSATGTISDTSMHVHLSASDSSGKTVGGHMMSGCKVFTTIELVILNLSDEWTFERKTDAQTTYLELDPRPVRNTEIHQ